MRRFTVIFVLILGLSAPILPYPYVDSLLLVLDNAETEYEQLIQLAEISEYLKNRDPDTTLYYADRFLDLAEELEDESKTAQANFVLGVCYQKLGLVTMSIERLSASRIKYEELRDSFGQARVLNTFGNLWLNEGNFDQALDYYYQTLEIFQALGTKSSLPRIYLNIGTAHAGMGNHDEALDFYNRSLKQMEDSSEPPQSMISAYLNIGYSYLSMEVPDQSYGYYLQALSLGKKLKIRPRISDAYGHLGSYYNFIGAYDQAIRYFDSALNIAQEEHLIYNIKNNAESLSDTYEKMGDFEQALHYSRMRDILYDSIVLMEAATKLKRLDVDRIIKATLQKNEDEMRIMRLKGRFTFIALILVIISLFYIYRNYRVKKKANALLAEVDQLKSRMFSNISHELRSPLTLLLDPLEQMLDEDQQKKISVKTAKLMHRNTRRLLDLINQMLDLSKLDEGKLRIEICKAGLVHHLKLTAFAFSSLAERKVIHYHTRFPEEEIETLFDPDKLEIILANLLSNAFKYTPVGGSVSLSVTVNKESPHGIKRQGNEDWVHISLHDTGRGIPESEIPKIFNRFYQVGGHDDPERVGTGIGLSLTKELVDLLGGEISVESKLEHGTHFSISIPLGISHLNESDYVLMEDPAYKKRKAPEYEEEVGPSIYSSEREDLPIILTVEDSEDIRSHIRDNLTDFNVLEAPDGEKGLERAIEVLPDLVITDLRMPKMDGVELCEKLKTDERTSHIPVIMLTAKIDVKSRIEGFETGADDYLTKPFNIKELKVRVRNLIEQRKKLQELYSKNILLEAEEIQVTSADERFLEQAMKIIEGYLSDPEFSVEQLSNELAMSRMQTFRKVKALTDKSPGEFIRTIRLKRAAHLIKSNFGNLAEITYEVGFNNPSYFAKCFRELYGVSPSEYSKN